MLELGGKFLVIIVDDVDFVCSVDNIMLGKIINVG